MRTAGFDPSVLTGILLSIAKPLAEVGVSIFAISTFDTDYVLVRASSLDVASAVTAYGHRLPEKYSASVAQFLGRSRPVS